MTQMKIREAVEKDFDSVIRLMKQLTSTPEKVNAKMLPFYKKSFLTALEKENVHEFVCEIDNKIVGHITLSLYWDFWHLGNVMIIDGVIVDEAFRGKGIGKELMKFAADFAQKNGVKIIYFYTEEERKDAQSFYEKVGYKKIKKIFFFKKIK